MPAAAVQGNRGGRPGGRRVLQGVRLLDEGSPTFSIKESDPLNPMRGARVAGHGRQGFPAVPRYPVPATRTLVRPAGRLERCPTAREARRIGRTGYRYRVRGTGYCRESVGTRARASPAAHHSLRTLAPTDPGQRRATVERLSLPMNSSPAFGDRAGSTTVPRAVVRMWSATSSGVAVGCASR